MRRSEPGRSRARVAPSLLAPTAKYTVPPAPPSFRPVIVGRPPSHAALGSYPGDRVRLVDVWLDSLDAAHELPDGSLPDRRAA